jgi:putative transposase
MSENAFSEINLHITWHTKSSVPQIKPEIEIKLNAFLKHKIIETGGAYFHAVGGTENHIHLAVSVEPELLISKFIGELKGASSFYINRLANQRLLEWQRGYGVVSFGTKDLPWVVKYVLNQKEHHKNRTTYARLEKYADAKG